MSFSFDHSSRLVAAFFAFSLIASANVLLPLGYVSYDVTGPPNSVQFDITNNTGANATPFPDPTFPVATLVHFQNLSLTVTLEDGSTFSCPGAGCPSSPYFTLAADGQSFGGAAFGIVSGKEPVSAVLGGTFDTTTVTLNDGTMWNISPNAFFDASGLISPTITDPTGTCKDLSTGCLNDGDLAVIYAEAQPAAVPEPRAIGLLGILFVGVMFSRSRFRRNRRLISSTALLTPVVWFVLAPSNSWATNVVTVKLNAWTTPSAGTAALTYVNLTVSGMPNGTVDPDNVLITLSTTCGGAPSATTNASSVKHILGTSDRINFQLPGAIPTTGNYFVSVRGNAGSIQFSSGASCSEIAVTVGNSTLVVENLNDSGPGSLRAVLSGAINGDIIAFANGLSGTIKLTSGELPITHSVNIDGPAANLIDISGNKSSRVFQIGGALNVTIGDVTIANGSALGQGGGIFNNGSNLVLVRAVISLNTVQGGATGGAEGGGIYNTGGSLTVTNCQFGDNQALGGPGNGQGGGIAVDGASLTIIHSTLNGNMAQGGNGQGGGIFNGQSSTVTLSNTIISLNQALGGTSGNGEGGGIYNSGTSTLTCTSCSIMGNSALGSTGLGGGIYNLGTLIFDSATAITNNQASTSNPNIFP